MEVIGAGIPAPAINVRLEAFEDLKPDRIVIAAQCRKLHYGKFSRGAV
jgi:hypothetical protein